MFNVIQLYAANIYLSLSLKQTFMKKLMCPIAFLLMAILPATNKAEAQQYKLRQSTSVMGMKVESTVYVKGMRKRTESAGMMGMANTVEVLQCDLKRTIRINDKKKVYMIVPFSSDEEVIDENEKAVKPVVTTRPVTTTQKGGTIYMYYNITDTGERKKMYNFTARHVWTSQKMKPSADACTMKDSMIIRTDGWYIDLPEFNCPTEYKPNTASMPSQQQKPDCMDKFVTRKSGKGKLGFPLIQTTTMIMGDGKGKTTEFTTALETLEFSTAKLDSTLFTIPAGYLEVKTDAEMQDEFNMNDAINQAKKMGEEMANKPVTEEKASGKIRVGVYEPKGEGGFSASELQRYLASTLNSGKIEAIPVASEEDARKFNCDYSLNTEFTRVKSGSKMGGMLKVVKNADPNAASSFTIENSMLLKNLADGSVRLQQKIEGKYNGKIDEAAKRSLEEESQLVLKTIN